MTTRTLALEGEITISAAAELLLNLLSTLGELGDAAGAALRLDLRAVDSLDSAGVQLLLATRASLAARGQHLELAEAPPVVRDVLRCLGLGTGMEGSALPLVPRSIEVST